MLSQDCFICISFLQRTTLSTPPGASDSFDPIFLLNVRYKSTDNR